MNYNFIVYNPVLLYSNDVYDLLSLQEAQWLPEVLAFPASNKHSCACMNINTHSISLNYRDNNPPPSMDQQKVLLQTVLT